MRNRSVQHVVFSLMGVVVFASGVLAQRGEFAQSQRANADALRNYTWKTRTELRLQGESKAVTLEQVRYDMDGRLQKTTIGGSRVAEEAGGRGGPLRQRVVAKKKEEFAELMSALSALAASYAHLSPDRLESFAKTADVSRGLGAQTGSLRIHGQNVLWPNDDMAILIDPQAFTMRRVEIDSVLDGQQVHIVADYRSLANGLTYQARSVLSYPSKGVEVTVESFELQFVGRVR